jgi:hypothetical protein
MPWWFNVQWVSSIDRIEFLRGWAVALVELHSQAGL